MHLAALAALLIASGTGAADPADHARKLLAGCKATQVGEGVQFTCAGFVVHVGDDALAPPVALRTFLAGLETAVRIEISTAPSSLRVGGQTWQGVRFDGHRSDGTAAMEGLAYVRELDANRSRLVGCAWPAASPAPAGQCPELLTALAVSGPAPLRPASAAPMFLGKPVPVPDGCRVLSASDSSFRLACGEAAWLMVTRGETKEDPDRMNGMLREQLLRSIPGAADEPRRDCRVDGVETTCQVVALGKGRGRDLVFFAGAIVRGAPVAVGCGQKTSVRGVHPVCSSVLAF